MRWLILCVFLVGCGSDPLPPSDCAKAFMSLCHYGCLPEAQLEEAIEQCKEYPDTQACRHYIECTLWTRDDENCGRCERYLTECEKDLDNLT